MELTLLQQAFREVLVDIKLLFDEPMSRHTSFRIGGPAEVMVFPKDAEELSRLLKAAGEIGCEVRILGAGTNILAPDEGIKGLVICLKDALDGITQVGEDRIRVAAGVTMTRAAVFSAKLGLSGLEFAHGIPGTVGGGVYMNAGAYGGEICQVCLGVEFMHMDGTLEWIGKDELSFSYRHSALQEKRGIVVSADFQLQPGEPDEIRARMKDLQQKRSASQPLDLPSAGSAFKRPQGGYAAALIDQAGLKGFAVGQAAISTKHAGFAVNLGGASAKEMQDLLRQVSNIVYERSGIRLEPEVRIW